VSVLMLVEGWLYAYSELYNAVHLRGKNMEANLKEFITQTKPFRRGVPTRFGRRVREKFGIPIEQLDTYDVIVVHKQKTSRYGSGSTLGLETACRLYVAKADRDQMDVILDEMGVGEADRYTQVNDGGYIWMKLSLTADDDFRFCVEMYHLFDELDEMETPPSVDEN